MRGLKLGVGLAGALMLGCVGGGSGGGGSDGGAGSNNGGNNGGSLGGGSLGGLGQNPGGGGGGSGSVSTSVPRDTPVTEISEAQGRQICADFLRAVDSQINDRQFCTFLAIQGAAEDQVSIGGDGEEPPAPTAAECEMQVSECSQFIGQFLSPALCNEGEIEQQDLPEHCAQVTVGDVADCAGAGLAFAADLGQGWTCNDITRADELALGEGDEPPEPAACARINELCPELNEDEDENVAEGGFGPRDNGE